MSDRLQQIIAQKKREVAQLQQFLMANPHHAINAILTEKTMPSVSKKFKTALSGDTLAVIAEIKRRSPSKGDLASITNPVALAEQYVQGSANAISILTDNSFFSGSLEDLTTVAQVLHAQSVAILRKDFIIDRTQLAEAVHAGAHAVLLIVAALGERIYDLLQQASELGLHALVEVHDEAELALAIQSGAEIIGVNNRNLATFQIDTEQAFKLVEKIPASIIKVAESGIDNPALARAYHAAGFNAVLIGEALVKSQHPAKFIAECKFTSS